MKSITILSILFAFNFSLANSQPPIVVEEPTPPSNLAGPFMSCAAPSPQADFINISLIVTSSNPESGMVVAIRNPKFDDLVIESFQEGSSLDFSNFNLSPVSMISTDLKIEKLDQDGQYQISGGTAGFLKVANQTIDTTTTRARLKLNSMLGNQSYTLDCSVYPDALDYLFKTKNVKND